MRSIINEFITGMAHSHHFELMEKSMRILRRTLNFADFCTQAHGHSRIHSPRLIILANTAVKRHFYSGTKVAEGEEKRKCRPKRVEVATRWIIALALGIVALELINLKSIWCSEDFNAWKIHRAQQQQRQQKESKPSNRDFPFKCRFTTEIKHAHDQTGIIVKRWFKCMCLQAFGKAFTNRARRGDELTMVKKYHCNIVKLFPDFGQIECYLNLTNSVQHLWSSLRAPTEGWASGKEMWRREIFTIVFSISWCAAGNID